MNINIIYILILSQHSTMDSVMEYSILNRIEDTTFPHMKPIGLQELNVPISLLDINPNNKYLGIFKIMTPTERHDGNYGIHSGNHTGLDDNEYLLESVVILAQGMGKLWITNAEHSRLLCVIQNAYIP
jgi:hypothetical protein